MKLTAPTKIIHVFLVASYLLQTRIMLPLLVVVAGLSVIHGLFIYFALKSELYWLFISVLILIDIYVISSVQMLVSRQLDNQIYSGKDFDFKELWSFFQKHHTILLSFIFFTLLAPCVLASIYALHSLTIIAPALKGLLYGVLFIIGFLVSATMVVYAFIFISNIQLIPSMIALENEGIKQLFLKGVKVFFTQWPKLLLLNVLNILQHAFYSLVFVVISLGAVYLMFKGAAFVSYSQGEVTHPHLTYLLYGTGWGKEIILFLKQIHLGDMFYGNIRIVDVSTSYRVGGLFVNLFLILWSVSLLTINLSLYFASNFITYRLTKG